MSQQKYGMIIIGGGITGLSTACAWNKTMNKKDGKVLIIEKNPVLGGCVTTFARKGFKFDTVQLIPDSKDLIEYFDLDIDLVKFEGYFARIFLLHSSSVKPKEIRIPSGMDNFKQMLTEKYPEDQREIERFFKITHKIFDELKHLKVQPNFLQLFAILFKCRNIIKYSKFTFRDFLNSFHFKSNELIEIFDVFCAFSGMSAERCSALLTIAAMQTSLAGSHRPKDGFIKLPYTFKKKIEDNGGEIRCNSKVKKVLIEKGIARGVELENGEKLFSKYVVTTADTKEAMKNLVGYEVLSKIDKSYANKAINLKMSVSAFTISLGLDDKIKLEDLGLKCGYNVLTTGKDTFENLFKAFDNGETAYSPENFHCAAICPSLITGGKPVIIIRVVPMPVNDWKELRENNYESYSRKKEEVAQFFINAIDKYMIPGLKNHIIHKDIATPATFARYLGSPTGSNYDMAPYVENFGRNRIGMQTPVKNLFLPKFSHGIWPSMQAGLQVIDHISGGKIMKGSSRYSK